MTARRSIDDDDYFKDTRMSFGEHIEVLRAHLIRALVGFGLCLIGGFILDAIGTAVGQPSIGVGKPMLDIIQTPVVEAMRDYYQRKNERIMKAAREGDAKYVSLIQPQVMQLELSAAPFRPGAGPEEFITVEARMRPIDLGPISNTIGQELGKGYNLTALSAQEAFVVYFKVSIVCGLVLGSPWIFWQLWSFVAAGLYPHEKKYVHLFLPFSLSLFLFGVLLCQFLALPGAVKALLTFNEWLNIDPDLRLSEWLGFAILLPLVFGISFQTPLVMLFLERIGVFDVESYLKGWRIAVMVLMTFAAVITPTPDPVTMSILGVPMCGLYFLGILLCKLSPRTADQDVPESEELIGV